MSVLPQLFEFSQEDVVKVLAEFERTPKTVQEDVEAIKNWMDTQKHLPKVFSNERIAKLLIFNKFSVERTKERIENYFVLKKFTPQFQLDVLGPQVLASLQCMNVVVFPKLLQGLYRVFLLKYVDSESAEGFDVNAIASHIFDVINLTMEYDYYSKVIIIADMKNFSFNILKKHNPLIVKKVIVTLEKAYTTRFQAIYVANVPSYSVKFVNVVKSFFPKKISERTQILEKSAKILDFLSPEVTPEDYGGKELPTSKLHENLIKTLEEKKEILSKIKNATIDESLKPLKPINDEFWGYYGNFKQIDFD